MVLAYHIIITAYGSRLPNEPRGSRSVKEGKPAQKWWFADE